MKVGAGKSPREEFFYFNGKALEAVRQGRWKLRLSSHLRENVKKGQPPEPELFDLETDPSEMYDLAKDHPEVVARMRARLEEFARKTPCGRALDPARSF